MGQDCERLSCSIGNLTSQQISSGILSMLIGLLTGCFGTGPAGKVPEYKKSIRSYISACQEDPELKSFDASLQQRTTKLISSLALRLEGHDTEILSLDTLIEVCGFLVEVSQDAIKIITDSKEVVSKNKELKSLVALYSESTNKTLKLFNTVEKCVEKAENSMLNIRVAIQQFETESIDTKNKYAETLEKLKKVKAMEDPFGDEFTAEYKSVCAEHVKILGKICELQVMFEKKHKNVKTLRMLGNILFVTAFFSVLALSTVASLSVAATIAITLTSIPTAAAGIWVNEIFKGYEEAIETKKDFFRLTEERTQVNIEAMKTIKSLVDTVTIRISSILTTVEVTVEQREEETVKLVMQEIIRKVEGLADKIEELGTNVAKCSKVVASGRVLVLEHITKSASL